jgi:integrase
MSIKLLTPIRRKGFWILRRRVPAQYAGFDNRKIVRISTHIRIADDPKAIRAAPIVQQINRDLEAEWLALVAGEKPRERQRYDQAVSISNGLGFKYLTTPELVTRPAEEIVRRSEVLVARMSVDSPEEASAVFGGEDRPVIRVSGLKAEFVSLQKATLAQMSPGQQQKWHDQRRHVAKNFLEAIGSDKKLTDLTKADGMAYRNWWMRRITEDGLQINTANKHMGMVSRMLKRVSAASELDIPAIFSGLNIEGGIDDQREPFENEFIRDRILAPGVFDDLNADARRVLFVMVETGLRPSEIVSLTARTIHLNHPVPHVTIVPEGRILKTEESRRHIPLVGVSLAAMKLQPKGFARYHDKASSLSGIVNKYLLNHGLRPTEKHTLYSLRHSFEDRLTGLGIADKLQAYLMGHKYDRPKYGSPPKLDQLQGLLGRIAFARWPADL